MPMIYICRGPKEKQAYLDKCKIIGKGFPVLTETEFMHMMNGLHNAYKDWGPTNMEFTLEITIKNIGITTLWLEVCVELSF